MNILRILMALAMMLVYSLSLAQLDDVNATAIDFMQRQTQVEGFSKADFQDFEIIQSFQSRNNGVTHIYIIQKFQGVEIENAIFNVNVLPDGKVLFYGNKGVPNFASKVDKGTPTMGCHEAFGLCLKDAGIKTQNLKTKYEKSTEIRFEKADGLFDDVLVKKMYAKQPNGSYRLVWDMNILTTTSQEAINYQVDVNTGQILRKNDITIRCDFDHIQHNDHCRISLDKKSFEAKGTSASGIQIKSFDAMDNSSYRIYPIPGESPNHINRNMVASPADPIASPFGWHDIDGIVGPEFTITNGNNVHASSDHDGDDTSDGMEPDGGTTLEFDFPIDLNDEPKDYTDAATVNLFYMNNIIHDVAYRYGFDEAAGNFQIMNYTGMGAGGDPVNAFAQSNIDNDPDKNTRNNANFSPSAEGFDGRMRMYVWERGVAGSDLLEILAPSAIAGTSVRGHTANFGPELPLGGISGNVVLSDDGSTRACDPLINGSEISGNIAIVDRGICNFDLKVKNAADAGAIAVIVCNFEEETFRMGGTIDAGIPAVMIGNQDCIVLKTSISQGLNVRLQIPTVTGPEQVDGTLDNGIVAHEYGHGISTRLVGGSQRAGCLSNDQQMGEGWSDFFTLILSVENGDNANTPRGIGTFVERDDPAGLGIRRFPYSADMNINPLTFGDIVITGSSPHNLGAVWCTMIWDLYWAFADRDGFDPDVYEGNGGNNTAIQLIMDGMKMLECSPNFTAARDAILAADIANNGGANQCLIWDVFARRGLGLSAFAGDDDDRTLAIEAFDTPGTCDPGLKLAKEMTELINPGDAITVTLELTNDKSSNATNIVLTDVIPAGATFINNSASQAVQINGDQLTFNVGSLNPGQSRTVSYMMNTTDGNFSNFIWFDGAEDVSGAWAEDVMDGVEGWNQSGTRAYNGDFSFFIKNDTVVTDRGLRNTSPVNLDNRTFPVLRFYHYIKSERGFDSGIVQISRDGGNSWEDAGDKIYKNGYTGKIPYQPFAIVNQKGYFGDSEDFVESYVDLRDYIGDDIFFRFRFGSDDETVDEGWYVDEVAIFDMQTYQSQACAVSDENDNVCAEADFFGSVINYDLSISTDNPDIPTTTEVNVHPNPTKDWVNITITGVNLTLPINYKLFNVSGKYMAAGTLMLSGGSISQPIDVRSLPVGMYFVNFIIDDELVSKRFIKQE